VVFWKEHLHCLSEENSTIGPHRGPLAVAILREPLSLFLRSLGQKDLPLGHRIDCSHERKVHELSPPPSLVVGSPRIPVSQHVASLAACLLNKTRDIESIKSLLHHHSPVTLRH
jgi:hypothetical protein